MDIIFKPGKILTYEYFKIELALEDPTNKDSQKVEKETLIFQFSLKTLEDHKGFKQLLEQAISSIQTNSFLVDINLSNGYLKLKFPLATVEQKEMYLAVCHKAELDVNFQIKQWPNEK